MARRPSASEVNLTHGQSVVRLPPEATVLAESGHDQFRILRYGPMTISVQFHPVFTLDIMGRCVMWQFLIQPQTNH